MTTKEKSRRWLNFYNQGHQRPCSDRVENLTFPLYRPSFLFYLVCTPCTLMFALLFTKRTKNRKRIVAIVLVMVAVLYQLSVVFFRLNKYINTIMLKRYLIICILEISIL